MQVSFCQVDHALYYGAPTAIEQRGIQEVAKGNYIKARDLFIQAVVENPHRVEKVCAFVGVFGSSIALKESLHEIATRVASQISTTGSRPPEPCSRVVSHLADYENESGKMPLLVKDRLSEDGDETKSKDLETSGSSTLQDVEGLRRRKTTASCGSR